MIAAIWRFMKSRNVGPPPRRGYDAFISYSLRASEPLARELERALRKIARPWYRVGGLRVFRDTTNLGATPDLARTLVKHLRASNFLVLIASKGAANSVWVEQELRHWFEVLMRPADKAVVVLSDGDLPRWNTATGEFDAATLGALPAAYLRNCRAEPLFVDMRWIDQTKTLPTLKDARFLGQVADIATPLLGKESKDEVISEELKRRKQVRGAIAAAAALVVALGAAVYWLHDRQTHIVRSEALAKRAGELTRDSPDQALVFALAAHNEYPTHNAERALLSATFRSSGLVGIARRHSQPIATLQFVGPSTLVSADVKGEVRTWEASPQQAIRESRPALSLGVAFPKDESTERVPQVKSTIVVAPGGQWVLAINSAEGQEDTISESRAAMVALAGAAPPLPPDLAQSLKYMRDTIDASPDGQRLTLFSGIDEVKRWTVGAPSAAETAKVTERCFDQRAVSRDASTAVCKGFVDDPLTIWDVVTNQVIGKVPMAVDESVGLMTLSEGGELLALTTQRGLRVVPLRRAEVSKEEVISLDGPVSALAFSPSGKLLAVSERRGRLLVLGMGGRAIERVATFNLGASATTSLAFSPDGLLVAAGSQSGAIQIWSLGPGDAPLLKLTGSRTSAGLAVSADEGRVAFASTDAGVTRVVSQELRTGRLIGKAERFDMDVVGIGFAGDRVRVLGARAQSEQCASIGNVSALLVETIDPRGQRSRVTSSATRCDLVGAHLAPKGVVTIAENGVALWREETGVWADIWRQSERIYTNPEMASSADGTRVAFAPIRPWDTRAAIAVQIWSLLDGVPRKLASIDQTTPQFSLFLSGDGSVLAVRTASRIDLWRIDADGSATSLGNVEVDSDQEPAALDREGSRLAVAQENGAIELWETRGPSLAGTIPAPATPARIAQLAFPGRYLLVVSQNGVTRRLDTQLKTWVERACSLTAQIRNAGDDKQLLGEPIPPGACTTTVDGTASTG